MRKLTEVQTNLLNKIKTFLSEGESMPYENIKNLAEFKSFDSSFNALIFKGWVVPQKNNDFSNRFKLA